MQAKTNITGIILAGGKSLRMGSDKGFVNYNNKAFMQHSIDALKPLVEEILIVSNNSEYDRFKQRRVTDIIENEGPLVGVYSGLFHSKSESNLVLSCDIPLITTKLLKKLISPIYEQYDIVQLEGQGRKMPLIARYHKRCVIPMLKLLEEGERRMSTIQDYCKVKTIVLNPEFDIHTANINTPQELNEIENGTYY